MATVIHASGDCPSSEAIALSSLRSRQPRPVLRRRLPEDLLAHAIDMRERLKPNLKSNLANPLVGIDPQVPGLLNAHARKVVEG